KLTDILKFPLIYLGSRADWANWPQAAGLDDATAIHGPVLNRASMVIDAAINGQGIALARTTLAAWEIINGRLVRPFADSLRLSKTYRIVCPQNNRCATKGCDLSRVASRGSLERFAAAEIARLDKKASQAARRLLEVIGRRPKLALVECRNAPASRPLSSTT